MSVPEHHKSGELSSVIMSSQSKGVDSLESLRPVTLPSIAPLLPTIQGEGSPATRRLPSEDAPGVLDTEVVRVLRALVTVQGGGRMRETRGVPGMHCGKLIVAVCAVFWVLSGSGCSSVTSGLAGDVEANGWRKGRKGPTEESWLVGDGFEECEEFAVSMMKRVMMEQDAFRWMKCVDVDGDGVGEFASGIELCRAMPLRSAAVPGSDPAASTFESVSGWYSGLPPFASATRFASDGTWTARGYKFTVFLPDASVQAQWVSVGLVEGRVVAIGGSGTIGIDASESKWCAYAVPIQWGETGKRLFFTGQFGELLECENLKGVDANSVLDSSWAFRGPGVHADIAIGQIGRNGELWTRSVGPGVDAGPSAPGVAR